MKKQLDCNVTNVLVLTIMLMNMQTSKRKRVKSCKLHGTITIILMLIVFTDSSCKSVFKNPSTDNEAYNSDDNEGMQEAY